MKNLKRSPTGSFVCNSNKVLFDEESPDKSVDEAVCRGVL